MVQRPRARPSERHCRTDDAAELFQEGLQLLAHHRNNYGPEGPKYLEVLWWEWPPLHWDELRKGGSMNFMEEPNAGPPPEQ